MCISLYVNLSFLGKLIYVYVSICILICVYIPFYIYFYVHVFLLVCIYIYVTLYICFFICISLYLLISTICDNSYIYHLLLYDKIYNTVYYT